MDDADFDWMLDIGLSSDDVQRVKREAVCGKVDLRRVFENGDTDIDIAISRLWDFYKK